MTSIRRIVPVLFVWLLCAVPALSVERFPPPQFETDYTIKTPTTPMPRAEWMGALDVVVLLAALSLASWLVLKKRSRKGIVAMMLFSLLYFGFWRQGCICSVGAVGNVTLGIFNSGYGVPWVVVAFFFLPLVFTLFFGRTFCAAVCPLGAVQDIVALKPLAIPRWLEATLRLLAWLYLSLAILLAATSSALIICRYDPFVSFFRFSGNSALWVISLSMLVIAVFVGRPYCRFLCPYGLILRQIGRISRFWVTITPDECIHCRLCEDACPFGAIDKPTVQWPQKEYVLGRRRLLLLMVCLPLFIAAGTGVGYAVHSKLARVHPDVKSVRSIKLARPHAEINAGLNDRAAAKQKQFAVGSSMVGGWMGLVAGVTLIQYSIFWKRRDYQAQRTGCVACGRCYQYCPQHRVWKKKKTGR